MSSFDMVGRPWAAFFLSRVSALDVVRYFYRRRPSLRVFCANNSETKSFVSRAESALMPINVNLLIFKVNEMLFASQCNVRCGKK